MRPFASSTLVGALAVAERVKPHLGADSVPGDHSPFGALGYSASRESPGGT